MKDEKINNSHYGYELSENTPLSAQSPQQAVASRTSEILKGRGKWARRSMVSCLLGSLLLMLATMAAPIKASAAVDIFVSFGPPAIPVYEQPYCPGPSYIWTPGYWAWDPDYGYYWVPGTWVPAPFIGAMWTPGYWGWYNNGYMWYPGYWGTAVGFYGGIDYGYGYNGYGYYGGYWRGNNYYYNRQVNRINNVTIVNVYNQRVVERGGPRISYNGGRDGINARPTTMELAAARTRRFGADNRQVQQERWARSNRSQWASQNHGRPEVAATPRPGEFRGNGVVRATRAGAPYNPPAREMRRGSEAGRPSSAPVERRPQTNAPRQAQPNRQMERPAPRQETPNRQMERPAPRQEMPNQRMERPAPRQETPNRQMERPAPPNQRMERQPQPNRQMERPAPQQQMNERQMNRNDRPPQAQQQRRESPPPQARPNENRGGQERQAHPPNQGRQERGNGQNNSGHGRR